jgi:nitroreductase
MTADAQGVVELLLGRRSVRTGYDGRPIPHDVLERIVRCGCAAPRSKNAGPARLTVVTDRARLSRIAEAVSNAPGGDDYTPHDPRTGRARPGWTTSVVESAEVLAGAPVGIFVENAAPFSGGRAALLQAESRARSLAVVGFELELVGVGAAIENLWLAALAEGLSAAFLGDVGVAEESIRRELGLRGDLVGALVVGYAAPSHVPPPRQTTADELNVRWDP